MSVFQNWGVLYQSVSKLPLVLKHFFEHFGRVLKHFRTLWPSFRTFCASFRTTCCLRVLLRSWAAQVAASEAPPTGAALGQIEAESFFGNCSFAKIAVKKGKTAVSILQMVFRAPFECPIVVLHRDPRAVGELDLY
jgi:hypothetical protein